MYSSHTLVKKCRQMTLKPLLCYFFFPLLLRRLWENWVYRQCYLSILLLTSVIAATLRLLPTTMICRLWINSIKENKTSFCSHGAYKSVLRHRKLIYNLIIVQCARQWSGTYIFLLLSYFIICSKNSRKNPNISVHCSKLLKLRGLNF